MFVFHLSSLFVALGIKPWPCSCEISAIPPKCSTTELYLQPLWFYYKVKKSAFSFQAALVCMSQVATCLRSGKKPKVVVARIQKPGIGPLGAGTSEMLAIWYMLCLRECSQAGQGLWGKGQKQESKLLPGRSTQMDQ